MAEEIYRSELSEYFVDDFEGIEQKIFVDKLLAQKKS